MMNPKMMRKMMLLFPLAMMASNSFNDSIPDNKKMTEEEYREYLKLKLEQSKRFKNESLLKKGCSEWEVDGIIVIALNYKNAVRKVKNILKVLELNQ